jgi:hypothetical protein
MGYGLTLWFLEPARAGSLTTTGGLRVAQLLGLAALVLGLLGLRLRCRPSQDDTSRS